MSKYRRLDVEGRGEKGEERAGDEPSRLGQRRGGVWGRARVDSCRAGAGHGARGRWVTSGRAWYSSHSGLVLNPTGGSSVSGLA